MKPQLTILAWLIGLSAFSQPIVRNQLDTNSPPRVTQDLFNSAALYTNSGSAVYYLWTNRLAGAWLGIVPGLGLVKSNSIAGVGSLLAGTNGAPNIGGMVSVGAGSAAFTNKVTIGSNQIAAATLSVQGNGTGLALMVNTNQLVVTNGFVGIGTANPIVPFQIKLDSGNCYFVVDKYAPALPSAWFAAFNSGQDGYVPLFFQASKFAALTGNFGIGTATPATTLHVSGGNITVSNTAAASQQSVIITTNGQIFITAPTNAVAPPAQVLQPIGYFASMMLTNTNTVTIGAGSTYYVLTNFTTLRTNGFVTIGTNGFITNVTAGFYRITCNVSMVGGGSDTLEGALFLDETRKPEITVFGTYDNPARIRTMSASGILYMPAATGLSFRLNNNSGANNITVWRAGVTIGTP